MDKLNALGKTIGELPFAALVTVVILAGFALAAYAIYAVTTQKERRR